MALLYASKYNKDELVKKNDEIDSQIKAVMEQMFDTAIEPLSDEDLQKIADGEASPEEVLAILTGKDKKKDSAEENTKTENKAADTQKINSIIAEVYALRATYSGRIDGLLGQGIAEWRALSHEERTLSKKLALAEKYMGRGRALEAECDGRMGSILSRLEAELSAAGESTAIVSQISALYNQEKAAKKAALLSYYPK